jgi:hypothetical protein
VAVHFAPKGVTGLSVCQETAVHESVHLSRNFLAIWRNKDLAQDIDVHRHTRSISVAARSRECRLAGAYPLQAHKISASLYVPLTLDIGHIGTHFRPFRYSLLLFEIF